MWNNIPWCRYTTFYLPVQQLMNIWVIFTFWQLWIMLLWMILSGHMFSSHLGTYLGMEFLGHIVALYLTFWGNARLFSKMTIPFYNPTSIVQVFQFLHVFTLLSFFIFYFTLVILCDIVSHCGFMLFFHLAIPPDLWDLSSLTRDRTCAPCSGRVES